MCFALSKTNICKTAEGFEVTMRIVLINNCHSIPVALNVLALKNKRASFFFFSFTGTMSLFKNSRGISVQYKQTGDPTIGRSREWRPGTCL